MRVFAIVLLADIACAIAGIDFIAISKPPFIMTMFENLSKFIYKLYDSINNNVANYWELLESGFFCRELVSQKLMPGFVGRALEVGNFFF